MPRRQSKEYEKTRQELNKEKIDCRKLKIKLPFKGS